MVIQRRLERCYGMKPSHLSFAAHDAVRPLTLRPFCVDSELVRRAACLKSRQHIRLTQDTGGTARFLPRSLQVIIDKA